MAKKKTTRRAARAPQPTTTERRILFYRITSGQNAAGVPAPLDLATHLQRINGLAFDDNGRYYAGPDGSSACCWPDRWATAPFRFRLGMIRRGGFPLLENGGQLSDLRIPQQSGLVELTHMCAFADGILGAVFNFYGPRAPRLGGYLGAKCQLTQPAQVEALLRQDVLEEFDRLGGLRLLDLKVRPSFVDLLTQADEDLGAAFAAANQAGNAEHIQLVLRSGRGRDDSLGQRVRTFARRVLRMPTLQEHAERFVVEGYDADSQRVEELDLLNDKLVARKAIIRQGGRNRALDDESAYQAIEQAHHELRDELQAAAGVTA